jgi:hypothetical protein
VEQRLIADQREVQDCRCFLLAGFPSYLKGLSERPGAVQGAPSGAAKRTLDGEDRSDTNAQEGKPGAQLLSISETMSKPNGMR